MFHVTRPVFVFIQVVFMVKPDWAAGIVEIPFAGNSCDENQIARELRMHTAFFAVMSDFAFQDLLFRMSGFFREGIDVYIPFTL